MSVSIDRVDIASEVGKILNDYGKEVSKAANDEVAKIGKDAKRKLATKSRSSIGGVKYNKSFKLDIKNYAGGVYSEAVLYNQEYSLTHLLEKGHVIANSKEGHRTKAYPHFEPILEWIKAELPKRITKRINNL